MPIQSLGWEDLEENITTHSSILARRIHRERSPQAMVHRVTKSWTQLKQLSMPAHISPFKRQESETQKEEQSCLRSREKAVLLMGLTNITKNILLTKAAVFLCVDLT